MADESLPPPPGAALVFMFTRNARPKVSHKVAAECVTPPALEDPNKVCM